MSKSKDEISSGEFAPLFQCDVTSLMGHNSTTMALCNKAKSVIEKIHTESFLLNRSVNCRIGVTTCRAGWIV